MDRRRFLATAGAAAAVVGFDALAGRWVTAAEARAAAAPSFDGTPPLDGQLYTDHAHRAADSTDMGNVVHILPAAVLAPGSVADIQKMVRFCRRHRIKVATRGQHHTMHGQGLSPGLLIENQWLDDIHSIGPTSAVVGAGVTWKQLIEATLPQGLRPRALLGFQGLSVGGTLAVGGCPVTPLHGGLVDTVRALEVVTGAGDVVECSEDVERELFEAMLGGLGQCGVITKATVDLLPAQARARTYWLNYVDARSFFADFRELFDRGEMNDCFNLCMPPGSALFVYQIQATVFYDPASPPDDDHLLRDLTVPPALAVKVDRAYYDYVVDVDNQVALLKATVQWEKLVKPWYDVWLPDDTVEQHVTEVVQGLKPDDVGVGGFVVLFAHHRSKMTRPFYRVPDARGADRVWLFDVATTSMLPGQDAAFAGRMTRRNRRWWARARALGGVRYPIGVLEFDRRDWARHYGDAWPEFARRKRRYDPDNIMTPGPGIF